ncbi:hypothetical protein [Pseudoflavonifractor phocaeensis]|uniref:hypothetical protein n=1 Tax=Pseudoflavonifractor phocaeensis TaxID=1870988 RepID=UPI0030B86F83
MEQENNQFLVTERVGKLMLKFAVPCVISLLVAALYNIVDQASSVGAWACWATEPPTWSFP